MNQYQARQEAIEQYGDAPTDTLSALAHTLRVYEGSPDSTQVLEATRNIYGPGVVTGLTLGDLRDLLARLS